MTTSPRPLKVLFIGTTNSARSIMAEYLLRKIGKGRFETHSAGALPGGKPHALTLRVLRDFFSIDASDTRSKPMSELREQSFDLVITVSDPARDAVPSWPGAGYVAHWGSRDPERAPGTEEEKLKVFRDVGLQMQRRVELLCNLPLDTSDRRGWESAVREIGTNDPAPSA